MGKSVTWESAGSLSGLVCWENTSLDWRGGLEEAMSARLKVLVGSVEPRMAWWKYSCYEGWIEEHREWSQEIN